MDKNGKEVLIKRPAPPHGAGEENRGEETKPSEIAVPSPETEDHRVSETERSEDFPDADSVPTETQSEEVLKENASVTPVENAPDTSIENAPEISEEKNSEPPEERGFDESPIVVASAAAKRKKYLKPWSELSKNERINRVLAVVMAIALVAIVTFTTVWCCTIADKAYNTPQWKTEREVYRNNIEKRLEEIGSGLKVAEEKYGENHRWFLLAKERYDMRYQLFPADDNVAGYRLMFLDTYRDTTESTVFTWNVNAYVNNFDGDSEGTPVLTEDDGTVVELAFWNFEAREQTFSSAGKDGTVYANYKMSAIIDGRLYTVTGQCQSPDGKLIDGASDWVRLYGKKVMSHLNEINL